MRRGPFAIAAVALLAVAGVATYAAWPRSEPQAAGEVAIGGPFTLVDQNGVELTEAALRGHFSIVYFGYTYCPDICPLGLQTITEALEKLPADESGKVEPYFISVDPGRDTVPVLRQYVQSFHPRLRGLTGSAEQVEAAVTAYKVYARKADPEAGKDYLVDHSTFTYVMGPDGRYVAHFGHDVTADAMAEKLSALVGAAG